MIKISYKLLLLFCFISCKDEERKVIACGSNKIIIIDVEDTIGEEVKITWQWQPSDAKSLPLNYRQKYFNKIDECKPTEDGKNIMITSSTGGVAIIDKKSKDAIFFTQIGNPHSIEELPNDIIAVAASNSKEGNCIALYQKNNTERSPFFKDSLYAGHGVVWDKNRQLLYALGENELRTYKLMDWSSESPKIQIQKQWDLPNIGGHDLVNFNSKELLLTTNSNVWLFNKELEKFDVFKPLENVKNVKGISISNNNRLIYVKAEESWWSHHIHLTNPTRVIEIPSVNLYKVRWWNFN